MGLIVGTDEAGYGPNLGPLVISATAWTVPGEPRSFEFWEAVAEVISQTKTPGKLHIADSKQVYSPSKGLKSLEANILPILWTHFGPVRSFRELTRRLTNTETNNPGCTTLCHPFDIEPWFENADIELPFSCHVDEIKKAAVRFESTIESAGIQIKSLRSDVVLTQRFNEICETNGTKGAALSRTTFQLIRDAWKPLNETETWVIGDKHGGRNRYLELIYEICEDQWAMAISEGRQKSEYKVGQARLTFRTGAESFLPVAVSSMICKYVRELAMELFNDFWLSHIENLKPTKGYPQDARRFRAEIAETQRDLGISDAVLWRER